MIDSSWSGSRAVIGALVLTPALLLAACSGSESGSEPESPTSSTTIVEPTSNIALAPFAGDDLYATPDPIPAGDHGTLLRYEEVTGVDVPGGTAYRIMYLSESLQGEAIVVTGIASVPTADAPDDGRPMITIAHGTTGIADECAPSKDPERSEFTLVAGAVGDEYLVAATDYEGLGTPGRHPYLVGESEGRSSIDALLAARQLPGADSGDRFATTGYSQGGHGALWASQVAAEWAPDLEVVATFAGAPASETDVVLTASARIPALAGFTYMIVAGFAAAYPEADPALFLTEKGVELLDAVDTGCASDTFAAVAGTPVNELLRDDAGSVEPWKTLGKANNAGTEKTNDAPTLVVHSRADETVPLVFSELLLGRMCNNDQVVERRLIDGGGHGAAAIPAYQQALEWIGARFASDPGEGATAVTDSCPT